ncbi:hypothetical protein BU17DRAFT_92893 [Hysterangium stoloniferum]|nr:hypothetical protein BU17DRAFT_92893 [Hysterangium stoloniferum]
MFCVMCDNSQQPRPLQQPRPPQQQVPPTTTATIPPGSSNTGSTLPTSNNPASTTPPGGSTTSTSSFQTTTSFVTIVTTFADGSATTILSTLLPSGNPPATSSRSSSPTGAIIGGTVGGVVALAILGSLVSSAAKADPGWIWPAWDDGVVEPFMMPRMGDGGEYEQRMGGGGEYEQRMGGGSEYEQRMGGGGGGGGRPEMGYAGAQGGYYGPSGTGTHTHPSPPLASHSLAPTAHSYSHATPGVGAAGAMGAAYTAHNQPPRSAKEREAFAYSTSGRSGRSFSSHGGYSNEAGGGMHPYPASVSGGGPTNHNSNLYAAPSPNSPMTDRPHSASGPGLGPGVLVHQDGGRLNVSQDVDGGGAEDEEGAREIPPLYESIPVRDRSGA